MSRIKITRRRGFTRLSPKRQVTVPLDVVERSGLAPGDELKVELDAAGRIVLTPASRLADRRRAVAETAGALTGVYPDDYLERLRDEWR